MHKELCVSFMNHTYQVISSWPPSVGWWEGGREDTMKLDDQRNQRTLSRASQPSKFIAIVSENIKSPNLSESSASAISFCR